MKKFVTIILAFLLIFSNLAVFASDNSNGNGYGNSLYDLKSFSETMKVDMTEVNRLMDEVGFSRSDAIYYHRVDKLVNYMIENEMSFEVPKKNLYSNNQIAADKLGFRQKILEADINAIATVMLNNQERVQKGMNKLHELKLYYGEEMPDQITIQLDDGSTLKYSSNETPVLTDIAYGNSTADEKNLNFNHNTDVLGIQSDTWKVDYFDSGFSTYNGIAEVRFDGTLSYTKLRIETNTTWSDTGSSGVQVNSIDCFTFTGGIISVTNKLNYSDSGSGWARGVGDVNWMWQGSGGISFGSNYVSINFAINAGESWTEQLIKKYYSSDGKWEVTSKIYN